MGQGGSIHRLAIDFDLGVPLEGAIFELKSWDKSAFEGKVILKWLESTDKLNVGLFQLFDFILVDRFFDSLPFD